MARTTPRSARWPVDYLLLSVVWGSSFALIKIAVDDGVAPLWVALWRCAFGAVALVAAAAVHRVRIPCGWTFWGHATVVAALLNAVPFTLFAVGEQQVSSVLAGAINAATPLMTLLFVMLLVRGEPLTLGRSIGLLLGFAGVLCLLGVWNGLGGATSIGVLACLGATACYGLGFAYTRRFFSGGGESALALSTVQIGVATVELMLVAAVAGSTPTVPGVGAALALVVLGAVGTGYAFLLNLRVIQAVGATTASTVTYLVPVWSTAIGWVALSESTGWNTIAGALLVVLGVVIGRSGRAGRSPERVRSADAGSAAPGR